MTSSAEATARHGCLYPFLRPSPLIGTRVQSLRAACLCPGALVQPPEQHLGGLPPLGRGGPHHATNYPPRSGKVRGDAAQRS